MQSLSCGQVGHLLQEELRHSGYIDSSPGAGNNFQAIFDRLANVAYIQIGSRFPLDSLANSASHPLNHPMDRLMHSRPLLRFLLSLLLTSFFGLQVASSFAQPIHVPRSPLPSVRGVVSDNPASLQPTRGMPAHGVPADQKPALDSLPLETPATDDLPEAQLEDVELPSAESDSSESLADILDLGRKLEAERRWHDALSHYEKAVRRLPGQRDLEFRLDVARTHVDLARRYADTSFTKSVRSLSERDALALYSEMLLKIQTHYVDSANWRKLVLHGALTLDLACEDPVFLQQNGPNLTPRQIDAFRGEMRQQANSFRIADRREAYNAVTYFARRANERLGISTTAAVFEFLCGALNSLDEYSAFLTSAQLDEVFSQIEGNFVGLGIELKAADQSLLIVHVITGGPAHEAGMEPGDRIVAVSGRSTKDISTDEAADMLKGPEGSEVRVQILRDDEELTLTMTRRRVEVPSIDGARIIDEELGVGYFRLTSFQKTTSRDLDAALWDLHRQGMRSLIIDLRGNPGGLLSAAVEVADKFISNGAIVSTRGRSTGEDFDYRAHTSGTWRVPLTVLIDQDSASASEIFAGAIRDHRRGVLVGQRSFGKGSVQGIFPLQGSQAGLRLTTAKFYSPSGQPISREGVLPDVSVVAQTVARPTDGGKRIRPEDDDAILRAGLQAAREKFSQR